MTGSSPPHVDAWVLPASAPAPAGAVHTTASEGPGNVRWMEPSTVALGGIADALRSAHRSLARRPWREIARVVGRVADRLLDPLDDLHVFALRSLALTTGLSAEMAAVVLEGMARDWRADRLIAAVEAEPPLAEALDGLAPARPLPDMPGGPEDPDGRPRRTAVTEPGVPSRPVLPRLRARGYPLTLHFGAGTVPGVTATSMIRALLVKSAAWAKPGLGDIALPAVVARGLADADEEVAAAVAVTYWPGPETPPEALTLPDLVVAYGGDETVASLRSGVPATTPVVAYHHRLSFAAVAREALSAARAEETADAVARVTATFDQRGCVSPHLIFAESGGEVAPRDWAAQLARACERLAASLPPGRWTTAEASAAQQLRGAMELKAAVDRSVYVAGGDALAWTVVLDANASAESPCAARTVRVRPVDDLARIAPLLARIAPVLQTMGFAGAADRAAGLAETLSAVGVTRVCSIEDQAFPPPWWRHDGMSPWSPLVRWTELDFAE